MNLPPTNQYGTFDRNLTKEEWRWIKSEAERKMRETDNLWCGLHQLAQIRECEKHL